VLARYGALLKPKAWVSPTHEAPVLQALLVRRAAIAQDRVLPAVGQQVGAICSLLCTVMISVQLNSWRLIWDSCRWNDSRVVRCWDARRSKAGPARIRAVLYMAAVVGTRYNPHTSKLFMSACLPEASPRCLHLGAAMRKLVHLCFGVLKTQQSYQYEYLKNALTLETVSTGLEHMSCFLNLE
jgi:hypothetical protein